MFYGLDFLSLEQVAYVLSLFRQNAEADPHWKMQSRPPGVVREVYLSRMWIPFAGFYSTDYFALDFDPGPKGTVGQVILFSTDEATRTCVAPSFDEFLSKMLAHYAARQYHPAFGWSLDDLYEIPF
jgi:cell wall assembly regulator SMI1